MEAFLRHDGVVAAMNRANVDTDAIMPKQYLKSIRKFGYGGWVFDDWRYLDAGDVETDLTIRRANPEFELNQPNFKGATVLLAQENFGCGSSREHAVWGLRDFGFKVLLAPSFADIFMNNCFNNGILAICLPQSVIDDLFEAVASTARLNCVVDLQEQTLHCANLMISFEVEPSRRRRLLEGLDAIDLTLKREKAIRAFELEHEARYPWLFNDL